MYIKSLSISDMLIIYAGQGPVTTYRLASRTRIFSIGGKPSLEALKEIILPVNIMFLVKKLY